MQTGFQRKQKRRLSSAQERKVIETSETKRVKISSMRERSNVRSALSLLRVFIYLRVKSKKGEDESLNPLVLNSLIQRSSLTL